MHSALHLLFHSPQHHPSSAASSSIWSQSALIVDHFVQGDMRKPICKVPPFSSVKKIVATSVQISLNFLKNLPIKGEDSKSASVGIFSLRHACCPLTRKSPRWHVHSDPRGTGRRHDIFNYICFLSDEEVNWALLVLLFRLAPALLWVQT